MVVEAVASRQSHRTTNAAIPVDFAAVGLIRRPFLKPKSPFAQVFADLPDELPLHAVNNALLPGGELPLEFSRPNDLAMCLQALKSDQLIGIAQLRANGVEHSVYRTGCAGRIRQYRERKDGRLNLMLSGICRFRIVEERTTQAGYRIAEVDWRDFRNDFGTEDVEKPKIDDFKARLRRYFDAHNMQVDWKILSERHIEEVVNNLVLVINLDVEEKQRLLETPTVAKRLEVFADILDRKTSPVLTPTPAPVVVN